MAECKLCIASGREKCPREGGHFPSRFMSEVVVHPVVWVQGQDYEKNRRQKNRMGSLPSEHSYIL
jgi:hypothetical protein